MELATPQRVADSQGITLLGPCGGGEFGAFYGRTPDGTDVVLKVRGMWWLPLMERGSQQCERARAKGYPAPGSLGIGVVDDTAWSLQERCPGSLVDGFGTRHVDQMLELLPLQEGSGLASRPLWNPADAGDVAVQLEALRAFGPVTRAMADECEELMRSSCDLQVPADGIRHGDFHHRNVLFDDDQLTAVIDWEGASAGDYRFDALLLALSAPEPAADRALAVARSLLSDQELAGYAAQFALGRLEFYLRVYPGQADGIVAEFDSGVARHWR